MKRSAAFLFLLCLALLVGSLAASDNQQKWKVLQVKHFTIMSGVTLTQDDANYFYNGLRERLRKKTLSTQVIDEGTDVPASDAADSLTVEGEFTSFEQGSFFGGRAAKAQVKINLYRISDHRLIKTITSDMNLGHGNIHQKDWEYVGLFAANDIVKAAKNIPPLSSFSPARPPEPSASAALASALQASSAEALTNNSVIEMSTAKLPEEVIIAKIQTSPANFDLSTPALVELNQKGVSPAVMKAMMMAPKVAPASLRSSGSPGADIQNPGTAELKHFAIAEGANFPARFDPQTYLALFPGELRTQLQRRKVHVQVVAENANAADPEATASIVVESVTLKSISKDIGGLASPAIINIETNLYNRSDHTLFKTVPSRIQAIGGPKAKGLPLYDVKNLAMWTAQWVADDIRKAVK